MNNEQNNPDASPVDADWRTLSVTAIAAENPSVAEYIAQLERDKGTFQRRLEKALTTIDELNEAAIDELT